MTEQEINTVRLAANIFNRVIISMLDYYSYHKYLPNNVAYNCSLKNKHIYYYTGRYNIRNKSSTMTISQLDRYLKLKALW